MSAKQIPNETFNHDLPVQWGSPIPILRLQILFFGKVILATRRYGCWCSALQCSEKPQHATPRWGYRAQGGIQNASAIYTTVEVPESYCQELFPIWRPAPALETTIEYPWLIIHGFGFRDLDPCVNLTHGSNLNSSKKKLPLKRSPVAGWAWDVRLRQKCSIVKRASALPAFHKLLGFGIRGASLCAAPERWKLMTCWHGNNSRVRRLNSEIAQWPQGFSSLSWKAARQPLKKKGSRLSR